MECLVLPRRLTSICSGIEISNARRVAKVLTFAAWAKTHVLLEILVCKTLVQKCMLLRRLLPRRGARLCISATRGYRPWTKTLTCNCRRSEKARCKKIFREKLSGASRARPEFQRMLDQLRPGDTVIVWKLDRLARSTRDLLETMETIGEAGARFQSLSEPWAILRLTQAR